MKNFRKVLALVLVVATLFSFVAMAGAKEYTDAEKISYTEAVDVLSAIGILNGYTDDSFKPTNSITRAEMAKMIAVLSNAGEDNVDKLYAAACDFADAKDHWAASYIAYCAQTGIVAGYSATAFGPEDKVTGLQTAKMLLVVLGLDAEKQGYTGANWKVNVLRDAKEFGLLDGFAAGYNVDTVITREEAANMMLNALKAPMVLGYLSENVITLTNKVTIGGKHFDIGDLIKLTDVKAEGVTILYGNVVVGVLWPLMNNFDGLDYVDGYDCFGRPGTGWVVNNKQGNSKDIGNYFTVAPTETYTTASSIASDFEEELKAGYTVTWVKDGEFMGEGKAQAAAADDASGKGVLTEVYVDHVEDTLHIVTINTYIGKVENENGRYGTAYVAGMKFDNDDKLSNGTVVLYKVCNGKAVKKMEELAGGKLHEVVKAEATNITVDETWTVVGNEGFVEKSWVVSGSDKYEYAENLNKYLEKSEAAEEYDDGGIINALADGIDVYLYLDEYGYVMFWDLVDESVATKVVYMVEDTTFAKDPTMSNGQLNAESWKYYGDMVDFTATTADDVRIDETLYTMDDTNGEFGYLVEVTEGDVAEWVATAKNTEESISADGRIGDLQVWCDDNTQFLVRTWDYSKGEYVYTDYTGIDNLPEGLLTLTYEGRGTLQYFASNNRATYVFLDAYLASAADYFVVLEQTNEVSIAKFDKLIEAMTCYTALVDGEESYVFVGAGYNDLEQYALYLAEVKALTAEYNGKPIYVAVDHISASSLKGMETLDATAGSLIIDEVDTGWRYNNDSKIIIILKDGDGTATVSDDYIVLEGKTEIESFDGVTGYNMKWYKAFGATTALDTLYIWVEAPAAQA